MSILECCTTRGPGPSPRIQHTQIMGLEQVGEFCVACSSIVEGARTNVPAELPARCVEIPSNCQDISNW